MPLQTTDFSRFGIQRPDYSGISNLFNNYYQGYEAAHTPRRLQEERVKAELERMNSVLNNRKLTNDVMLAEKYGEKNMLANLDLIRSQINQHNASAAKSNQEVIAAKRKQEMYDLILKTANGQTPSGQPIGSPQQPQMQQPQQSPMQMQQSPAGPGFGGNALQDALMQRMPQLQGQSEAPQNVLQAPDIQQQMQQQIAQQGMQEYDPVHQEVLRQAKSGNTLIEPGNPNMYALDQLYESNPLARIQMKEMFPEIGVKHHMNDRTGEMITTTTYPSGKVVVNATSAGTSPVTQERSKEFNKVDVKMYEAATEAYQGASETGATLDRMAEIIDKHPELFRDVTGPFDSVISKYLSDSDAKYIRGQLGGLSGNVMLSTAKDLKGAFTARDQKLIEEVKASPSDSPAVFVGKLEAQRLIHGLMQERRELIAKYIREDGLSSHEAVKKAQEETSFEQIEPQIKTALSESYQKQGFVTLENAEGRVIHIPRDNTADIERAKKEKFFERKR